MKDRVIIIGAGAMGIFSAYYLNKSGYQVLLFDDHHIPGLHSCSSSNAGMLVPSHFTPIATPSMVREGILSLLNHKAPFGIKWSGNPALYSFLLKMLVSSFGGRSDLKMNTLSQFHLQSLKEYDQIKESDEIDLFLNHSGLVMVSQKQKTFELDKKTAKKASDLGIPTEIWSAEEYAAKNPHLHPRLNGAVYYPWDGKVDPYPMLKSMVHWLKQQGVDILENTPVSGFVVENNKIIAVKSGSQQYPTSQVLITAGIASPVLAKHFNTHIPIQPARGVSFSFKNEMDSLSHPTILQDAHVAITPYPHYTRIAGHFELGERSRKFSLCRLNRLVATVRSHYPTWVFTKPEIKNIWTGFRPVSPDGLPMIGKIPGWENVWLNTGHAMMGISLAPVSGNMITQMISEQHQFPNTWFSLYDPARFIR